MIELKHFIPWRKLGLLRWLAFIIFLAILISGAVWVWMLNSTPYKVATNYILQSVEVKNILGEHIVEYSPKYFKGGENDTEIIYDIYGAVSKRKVKVKLNKKNNKWEVSEVLALPQ